MCLCTLVAVDVLWSCCAGGSTVTVTSNVVVVALVVVDPSCGCAFRGAAECVEDFGSGKEAAVIVDRRARNEPWHRSLVRY